MNAIFEARYSSECPACGWQITPGRLVTWKDDEVVHVACPESEALRPVGEVCDRCFMEKSTTGACGCDD